MIIKKEILFVLFLLVFTSCGTNKSISSVKDDGKIEIVVLQINDVYEIAPLPGDDLGGLARVATWKKQIAKENPNTIMVIAGDFLSPSVIGTLKDKDGVGIRGKHIIETLNYSGLDIAIFGNHEFDIKEADLQMRLDESEFDWVSSNVFYVKDSEVGPFYKRKDNAKQYIPKTIIRTFTDADGTQMKLGMFAVTLDVKEADHVTYEDPIETARQMKLELENQNVDMILPITHLKIADDEKLAKAIPGFPLIIGGHDHNNISIDVGETRITKADANAKTAYVHTITYDRNLAKITITSRLDIMDSNMPSDPEVDNIVKKWKYIAYEDLKLKGFDPDAKVTDLVEALDGTEKTVRGSQCKLGAMVTGAMFDAGLHSPDVALTNSGSIRIDDVMHGVLTQYDIIRILPYSGEIWEVEMSGDLLKRILEAGEENKNEGAYIQRKNVAFDSPSKTFRINGQFVNTDSTYMVALNDFMLAGYDFKWLTEATDGIINIHKPKSKEDGRSDIRKAVIQYLKK